MELFDVQDSGRVGHGDVSKVTHRHAWTMASCGMTDPQRPFPDEHALDTLNRWLDANGRTGLMLDGLHGLITVALVGPESVPVSRCLALALGRPGALQIDPDVAPIADALYQGTRDEIAAGDYEPILGELAEGGQLTARGWCEGFALGVDLHADAWEGRLREDPALLRIVEPIMRLAASDGVIAYDEDPEIKAPTREEYERLLAAIAPAVLALREYWDDNPLDDGPDLDDLPEVPEPPEAEAAPQPKRTLH